MSFQVGEKVVVSWMGADVETVVVEVVPLTHGNTHRYYKVGIDGRTPSYREDELRAGWPTSTLPTLSAPASKPVSGSMSSGGETL